MGCFVFFSLLQCVQKQPSRGILRKRRSEDMQQIYRRTPMPKWDFNKVAKQLYWSHTSTCVFSYKFAAYFQNTFSQEHLWKPASVQVCTCVHAHVPVIIFKYCLICLLFTKLGTLSQNLIFFHDSLYTSSFT